MLVELSDPFPDPRQRVRSGTDPGGKPMNTLRGAVLLLILWTLAGCAQAGPGSAPTPPPSKDDRGGMY